MNNMNFSQGCQLIVRSMSQQDRNSNVSNMMVCDGFQIWFGIYSHMRIDDLVEMKKLGWFVDDNQWSCYVH